MRPRNYLLLVALLPLVLAAGLGCRHAGPDIPSDADTVVLDPSPKTVAQKIINGAKEEVLRGVAYNAAYVKIAYPGGDVAADRGACTDVVIRALRHAGYDLQKLIHEDMISHFDRYPRRYGLRAPDSNIDHRRTPNQIAFLRRHGRELPMATSGTDAATWQPGDLVFWELPGGVGHVGVCSDARNAAGLPLVIHNLSQARQEDCLTEWKITGHFRYPRG